MSFGYLAGVTLAAAPDEIVDWFATFEAWITSLGWTVEQGGGTTNLILRSTSEAGGLTMLYMNVYRDGGNPNRVRIEMRDDLAGTHKTDEQGYLDGAGFQFPYWMCGDKDAICICFRGGAVYNSIYAGMVLPFALTVLDETYRVVVTSTQTLGSILHDADGSWDVDHGVHDNSTLHQAAIDQYDGSLPLIGTFFDRQANIAGQLKHISGRVFPPAITVGSTLTTGRPGATTTWIVLQDMNAQRYAMRTGGVLPTGFPEPGTFAAVSGVAVDRAALWTALTNHLTGLGWVSHGDPGYWNEARLYGSVGESGEDAIFCALAVNYASSPDGLYLSVQDDLIPSHRYESPSWKYLDNTDFPLNYWICGDKDCFVLVWQRATGYSYLWMGLAPAFAPGLLPPYGGTPLTPYQLMFNTLGEGTSARGLLRKHNGTWYSGNVGAYDDGPDADNSNPNNFDGTTYLVWPLVAVDTGTEVLGQLRYVGYSSGGGIGNLDTITVGAEVWTTFFDYQAKNFMVRTV